LLNSDTEIHSLVESFADLAKEHEEVLNQLKVANAEKESLVKQVEQLKKSFTKEKVTLQKVASAGFNPIDVAVAVKKLETAGFIKEGSAKSVAEEILSNPANILDLVDAVASSFLPDDYSGGELSKSASDKQSLSETKNGKKPTFDKDGWHTLIED
jgi:hypothetical protein